MFPSFQLLSGKRLSHTGKFIPVSSSITLESFNLILKCLRAEGALVVDDVGENQEEAGVVVARSVVVTVLTEIVFLPQLVIVTDALTIIVQVSVR